MIAASPSEGLARWLTETQGVPVRVEGLEAVSAGARRMNALFDAVYPDGTTESLAVTAIPSIEIQILPVTAEAAVRTLAADAGVPTPRIVGVSADESYIGGPFFVSTRVDGETIPRRVLRLVEQHQIGERIAAQLGEAFATLHAIDADRAPIEVPRPETGPIETALVAADTAMETLLQPSPVMSYGMHWLERHRPPEPDELTIVHSDVRNGNIIVGPDGLRAILDWEGTRIGDRFEDIAWPCVRMWRFRNDSLPLGGFSPIAPYRAAYEGNGGAWDEDRFRWWLALGTLRWGLGLAGQALAHLDGRHRSIVMAASGRRITEMEYDVLLATRPN